MTLRKGSSHLGHVVRVAAGALLTASALVFAAAPADAHTHHRHLWRYAHTAHTRHVAHVAQRSYTGVPSSPAFSAIVVDANSGRTLYAAEPDGLRHPASITKVMTLYLLFEQLDKGALTLQSRIPISEHAAAQEPSKLGLEPGETISVEDAIKAVVTRSANDIAVAIAEAIGHDESTFAEMMTRKAHALGMANTTYRNASGLPNDQQITTARDLTVLARSLEDRFPRYFRYFSTEEFEYAGQTIGNHNHLLGRVDGVDGIKTGYTRASGFNLLTSVHRDGRSIVAVVMGGRSAPARDRDHGEPDRRPSGARLDGPHRDRGRRRVVVRGSGGRAARAGPRRIRPSSPPMCRRISRPRTPRRRIGRRRQRRGRRDADASCRGRPCRRPTASGAKRSRRGRSCSAPLLSKRRPRRRNWLPPPIPPGSDEGARRRRSDASSQAEG